MKEEVRENIKKLEEERKNEISRKRCGIRGKERSTWKERETERKRKDERNRKKLVM